MLPDARRAIGVILFACGAWGTFAGRFPFDDTPAQRGLAGLQESSYAARSERDRHPSQLPLPVGAAMALIGFCLVLAPERRET